MGEEPGLFWKHTQKQNSDREWGDKHKNELKHCSMTDRKSAILDQKFATSFAACFQNATSLRFLVQMSSDFTCHIQTHGFSEVIHVFSKFHTVRPYAATKIRLRFLFFRCPLTTTGIALQSSHSHHICVIGA
ncbi:hypothetical protein NQD34_013343 [Periophthalmus magnuspinnatus]|nr:hypothetical protein NQD34_013343 [Periophthalmus magnuspinnatus]